MTHETTGRFIPWETQWPNEGLEHIGCCPVCGNSQRSELHTEVVDNVFFCSPGKWTLWECGECRSAYLDPRPTQSSIHIAYENYYTHQEVAGKDHYASVSLLRKLRRHLINGYTNWRYSTHTAPSNVFGVLAMFIMPSLKTILDHQCRHMPRLPKGGGMLLDVGCGAGSFLSRARTCGWNVVGLDPDPKAAANAARQGLTVHLGSIEYYDGRTAQFDVITLNHVIEHVHDPVKVLKTCHALLKPGGQLWLETPNIDSFGHARFRQNWRGLETPRHLVLFNRDSLSKAFISAGFPAPQDRSRPSPCSEIYAMSYGMEQGYSPYQELALSKAPQWQATRAAFLGALLPSHREFLTVVARKTEC
jgi:2-polyprenyl-3-methyl-5-hydroxy-6-metoxy-1,4-benzoquinol methylase